MEASQTGSDSNLITEQPDQPAPSAQESVEGRPVAGALPSTDAAIYGTVPADQAARDAQLEADAQRHNERTGGGTIVEGEREAQQTVHRERTGTGDGTQGDGFQGIGPMAQQAQGAQPVGATDAPQGPATGSPTTAPTTDPTAPPAPSTNPTAPPAEQPGQNPDPAAEPVTPPAETQNPPGPASPAQA